MKNIIFIVVIFDGISKRRIQRYTLTNRSVLLEEGTGLD